MPDEDRERQARHHVVGGDFGLLAALRVFVDHLHAGVVLVHRLDGRVEGEALGPDRLLEVLADLVHAADRLEHRRRGGAFHRRDRAQAIAEAGFEQRRELHHVALAAVGEGLVGPGGAVEVAVAHEELGQALLVVGGERRVQLTLVDGLDEQLVDLAEEVGLHLAHADALVRQRPGDRAFAVEVVGVGVVEEHLHRHAELAAVAEDAGVRVRDAPGADVHVLALVPVADLRLAAGAEFRVCGALADAPRDAADAVTRLQHLIVVAELAELVGHDQPGGAGAEDQHLGPGRLAGERRPLARALRHLIPRAQGGHDQRRAADGAEVFEEPAAGQRR